MTKWLKREKINVGKEIEKKVEKIYEKASVDGYGVGNSRLF